MAKSYTSNFKEKVGSSSGQEPVYLLEISHLQLATPVRVVNDTQDLSFYPANDLSGQATAGTSNTLTLAVGSSSVTDFYKDWLLRLISGPGSIQERLISAYNGSTRVATISPRWATNQFPGFTEDFANGNWVVGDAANPKLPNTLDISAPDGTFTACKWVLNSIASNRSFGHSGSGVPAPANGRTDVFSFYVYIPISNSGGAFKAYMFATGEIPTDYVDLNVLPRNSWQRVSYSHTWGAGASGTIVPQFHQNAPDTVGDMMYIWHPQLELGVALGDYVKADTAAVVTPTSSTLYGLVQPRTFVACAFRIQLPDDISKSIPQVPISIDNVGRELTQFLEQSNGGKGATVRIMQVMRDTPDVIEQEYTLLLTGVRQNMLEVQGQLSYENFLDIPALAATFTPELAPGLF